MEKKGRSEVKKVEERIPSLKRLRGCYKGGCVRYGQANDYSERDE